MKKRIAVIGAGFSGLVLADAVGNRAEIDIYEKSRGVGGRMATRYADPFSFDHGAQFFTARSKKFIEFLSPHKRSGLVKEWTGKVITLDPGKEIKDRLWFEPHYVAVPYMNSLCKHLAENARIQLNTEVAPLKEKTSGQWGLVDSAGQFLGLYDIVISTAPPVQTSKLFALHLSKNEAFAHIKLQGCYTMMLGYNKRWDKPWIAAKVHNSPIEWIAINSTKPGRDDKTTSIVVHTSNQWAEEHINEDMKEAEAFLHQQFKSLTQIDPSVADYSSLHRWRYALVVPNDEKEDIPDSAPYCDLTAGLASVGDWCSASRIENVWINAEILATKIKAMLA